MLRVKGPKFTEHPIGTGCDTGIASQVIEFAACDDGLDREGWMRPQASSELMLLECSVDEEGVDHHGLDEGLEVICVAMFRIVEEGNSRCKTKGSALMNASDLFSRVGLIFWGGQKRRGGACRTTPSRFLPTQSCI